MTTHHHRGAGGVSSKQLVVGFAVVICMLNFYVYYSGPTVTKSLAAKDDHESVLPSGGVILPPVQPQPPPPSVEDKTVTDGSGNTKSPAELPRRRDASKKKNVLFIMTDDLRPSLSIYNTPVITPAMDRLAAMSVVFERAYNQVRGSK